METTDRKATYEIKKEIAILIERNSGWTKELNLISWNNNPAKFDIREWAPDREKMGKGITLSTEEMEKLVQEYLDYKKELAPKAVPEK